MIFRRLYYWWLCTLLVALGSSSAFGGVVRYRVDFDSTWSAETHPDDFPTANPHFSRLIGGTHSAEVEFWAPGGMATRGIEVMAENGVPSFLADEVTAEVTGGRAGSVVQGTGIGRSPGSGFAFVEPDPEFPLVTLVSMIAPSPDWFVGVHGLNLLGDGRWRETLTVDLLPYDAGTDSGVTYRSPDADTQPREPIHLLTDFPFEGTGPLGTFTFTLLPPELPGDLDGNGAVELADFTELRERFGQQTLRASSEGDFDQNGVVDLRDFGILKENFGAVAVPEPSSLLLLSLAALAFWRFAKRPSILPQNS